MKFFSFMTNPSRHGSTRKSRVGVTIAALFPLILLFLLSGVALAQDEQTTRSGAPGLEDLVPAETLLFMKCSGIKQFLEDAGTLDLFRLWNDSEVQAFIEEAKEMVPDLLTANGGPELPFQEAWRFLQGEFALALSSRLPLFENGPAPAAVIALNLGNEKESLMGSMNLLLDLAVEMRNFKRGQKSYRDFEMYSIGLAETGLTVHYTTIEGLLVATLTPRYLEEIIDCRLDEKPVLAAADGFSGSLNRVGGESTDLLAYINFPPFFNRLKSLYPFDVEEWLGILGMGNTRSICMATCLEGGVSRDSIFIDCPGERTGLLKSLSTHSVSFDNIRKAPPDTLIFVDLVFDPELFIKEVDDFLKFMLPEKHKVFRNELEEVRKMTGFDLESDILMPLGSELSFFMNMPRAAGMSMIPDFILSLSVEDEEGFNALLEKTFAMMEGLVEVTDWTYEGLACHHITIPEGDIPLSPAFTVESGRFLLAGTPMNMKRYLKWLKKEQPGLDGSEAFKEIMAGVPEGASIIKFADLRRSVEIGYGMAAPFMPTVLSQSDLPLDAGMLPMTETITDYISNSMGYMVMDGDGVFLSSECPFGLGTLAAAVVSMGDYFIENNLIQGLFGNQAVTQDRVILVHKQHPLLDTAFTYMRGRNHEAAEADLTNYIDSYPAPGPTRTWALTNRGDCLMKLEHYAEAVADYEIVVEMDRENRSQILYNIALAYTKLNQPKPAIASLEKAINAGHRMFYLDPEFELLAAEPGFQESVEMVTTASTLMRDSEYADAKDFFTEWIFNNPYHALTPWALKNRGGCFLKLERHEEAIADFKKAAKKDPSFEPEVFYSIACACSVLEQQDQAVDYLKKAVDSGFSNFELIDYDGDLDNVRSHPKFKALKWRW